jgi:hypothetical protein
MGNAVLIPATTTYPIYQTMSKGNDSLAEVGVFFLGTTAPVLTGPTTAAGAASYWNDDKNDAATTVGQNSSAGGTNDGTATSGGTCTTPGGNHHVQACTSCATVATRSCIHLPAA